MIQHNSLANVPQERFSDAVVLSPVVERVRLEIMSQLLRKCDMSSIIKAGFAEDQDGIFV